MIMRRMIVFGPFLILHCNHAPVRRLANHVLQLNCGVPDAKVLPQPLVDLAQNCVAL